jgi:hypothetical protein
MVEVVTEHLIEQARYREAIAVSDLVLEYYPTHVYAILKKGSASYKLLRANYMQKYPNPNQIPPAERPFFEYLSATNMQAFAKAEALGWCEPGREYDEDYLRRVNQAARQAQ